MSVEDRRLRILVLASVRGRVCLGYIKRVLPYWADETLRLDLVHLVRAGKLLPRGRCRGRWYETVEG